MEGFSVFLRKELREAVGIEERESTSHNSKQG